MRRAALLVPEHMRQLPDARQPRREQFLHREFGRGVEKPSLRLALKRYMRNNREGAQVRLEARADLQGWGLDFDKPVLGKKVANRGQYSAARDQLVMPQGKPVRPPPRPACRTIAAWFRHLAHSAFPAVT